MKMDAEKRRAEIKKLLSESAAPISAARLSEKLSVSRQIIVGDVALLRASGTGITATPRGYLISREEPSFVRTAKIPCIHSPEDTEKELNIFVDNGCTVIDTIVEHPVYGQFTGTLNIKSRYDVKNFIKKTAEASAHGLMELTDGVHLHTVGYTDEEAFAGCLKELRAAGLLYED